MTQYKNISFFVLMIIVISCTTNQESPTTELLMRKLDSMDKKIDSLKNKLEKPKDTVKPIKIVSDTITPTKKTPIPLKTKKPIEIKTQTVKPTQEIFYYTNTQKPSLVIEPWIEQRRKLLFYDLNGQLTYTQEDVRMSYSSSTTVKSFHPNGAVRLIEVHLNPGASMYMYQSDISFDENNIPLWKKETQWPSSLEDYMKPPYYWDRNGKTWKQQETVKETPYPNN